MSQKNNDKAALTLVDILLISNVFVWYSFVFDTLKRLTCENQLIIWSVHFMAGACSAIIGATVTSKINKQRAFLIFWIFLGTISSVIPIFINLANSYNKLIISFLFGVSFGLGLPANMGHFAKCTSIENRAKLGSLILLINSFGVFILKAIAATSSNLMQALILAVWRGAGLMFLLLVKSAGEETLYRRNVSFAHIFNQQPYVLYLIPWIMFSLVNYLSIPLQLYIIGADLVAFLNSIENVLIGIFAIISGFIADFWGRKRIILTGFIMLGLGYAVLGLYPQNLLSWYFYTLVDGIACGTFFVIFIVTIWGDLSYGVASDKHYAIGGLPLFISNFLRLSVGTYIAETVPAYAIFSFVAFFLFLAVVPLMYAPETLPEKTLRERELRSYIERAKRVREKFTKRQ
jgi:hypothetical protein